MNIQNFIKINENSAEISNTYSLNLVLLPKHKGYAVISESFALN